MEAEEADGGGGQNDVKSEDMKESMMEALSSVVVVQRFIVVGSR